MVLFDGLPKPTKGKLSLYVVGSGFGESAVVVFPEGEVVVTDSCMEGDVHFTLDLLDALGLSKIDLLLVTHSDLDHIGGIAELLGDREVREAWRFPAAGDVRALAAKWLRASPSDRRLRDLRSAMDALDDLASNNVCAEACADLRPWPPDPAASVHVTCLAPSQYDQLRSRAALESLIRMETGRAELADSARRFLDKKSRRFGTSPNVLSLAATIEWRAANIRLLLGGDVERGDGSPQSGWRGILATLDRRGLRRHVSGLHAVKVAHHGSRGAHEFEAWDAHTRPVADKTWAVVAPFANGDVSLPDVDVLRDLHGRGVNLAICDSSFAGSIAAFARWIPDLSTAVACEGPVVAFSWAHNGAVDVVRGKRAATFTP